MTLPTLRSRIQQKLSDALAEPGRIKQIDHYKTFIQLSYVNAECLSVIIYAKRGQLTQKFVEGVKSIVEGHEIVKALDFKFKERVDDHKTAWWGEYWFEVLERR